MFVGVLRPSSAVKGLPGMARGKRKFNAMRKKSVAAYEMTYLCSDGLVLLRLSPSTFSEETATLTYPIPIFCVKTIVSPKGMLFCQATDSSFGRDRTAVEDGVGFPSQRKDRQDE